MADTLGVTADAHNDASAHTLFIGVGAVTVNVAMPSVKVAHDVEIYIGPANRDATDTNIPTGTLTIGSGPINLHATSNDNPSLFSFGLSVGFVSIGVGAADHRGRRLRPRPMSAASSSSINR